MDTNHFPDCLVLKIEEHDVDTKELDVTVYILYDQKEQHYVIRGQRFHEKIESCTFSFNCKFGYELTEFISTIICTENLWTYSLYNYDNLPAESNDISYDFLKENDTKVYELCAYDFQTFNLKLLIRYLTMLRNVFNYHK
jgi:hypothetical protein